MKKKLFSAFLFGLLYIIQASSSHAENVDIQQQLLRATDWLQKALDQAPGSSQPIRPVILPMNIKSYQQFAAYAYPEEDPSQIGAPALSAFFQKNGFINQKKIDICYLLYNPNENEILNSQFISNHDKTFKQNLNPYIFLVTHELAHCYDFQRQKKHDPIEAEIFADAFAILILQLSHVSNDEIISIVQSRNNTSRTHSTWHKISPLLNQNSIPRYLKNIEEVINEADNVVSNN